MSEENLFHIDSDNQARMVDINDKPETLRQAVAAAKVLVSTKLFSLLQKDSLAKGDTLFIACVAGIQAAKKISESG